MAMTDEELSAEEIRIIELRDKELKGQKTEDGRQSVRLLADLRTVLMQSRARACCDSHGGAVAIEALCYAMAEQMIALIRAQEDDLPPMGIVKVGAGMNLEVAKRVTEIMADGFGIKAVISGEATSG